MPTFRVSLLVVCLAATSLFSQEPRPDLASPPYVQALRASAPEPDAQNPEAVPQEERKLSIVATAGATARGIASEADLSGTNGALLLDGAVGDGVILRANGTLRFQTAAADRMWIWNDGHVSVGGPYNQGRLGVFEYGDGGRALATVHHAFIDVTTNQVDYGAIISSQEAIDAGVTNNGEIVGAQIEGWNLGPGAVASVTGTRIFAGNQAGAAASSSITNATGLYIQVHKGLGTVANGYGVVIGDTLATNDWGVFQSAASDTNYFAGNVIIGGSSVPAIPAGNVLYVTGDANFNGTVTGTNIKAHYQDVAEWVPSTTDLAPGTVVILNRERDNEVMASATAYDTTVAGVVSAQPGLSLGVEGEGKEQVATTGRVKVRVDARSKPIRVGDLLVTSDMPGTAMRSEPMDLNGRPFHQPGTIIGKALQSLDSGVGEILVLLSMQ